MGKWEESGSNYHIQDILSHDPCIQSLPANHISAMCLLSHVSIEVTYLISFQVLLCTVSHRQSESMDTLFDLLSQIAEFSGYFVHTFDMVQTKQTARKALPPGWFMDKLENRLKDVVPERQRKPYTRVFQEMKKLQQRTSLIMSKFQMMR